MKRITTDAERKAFEEIAYGKYFLSNVTVNPNKQFWEMGDIKTQKEFCALNEDGTYVEPTLNLALMFYLKGIDSVSK